MSLFDFCLKICLVFIKCIEFGNVLSKLVVKLGKFNLCKSVKLYLEYGCLARKVFSMVFCGESNVYVKLFINGVANDLLFKAGNELAGAKLKSIVFTLATFKSNTVNKAFKINYCCVVKLSGTIVSVDFTAVSFSYELKLVVDFIISNGSNLFVYFDTEVAFNLNVGLNEYLCCVSSRS